MLRRFEAARHLLTNMVREKGHEVASRREWDAVPYEPYDRLSDMSLGWDDRSEPFLISSLHNSRTIYTEPSANWLFRLWHDSLHVKYQREFHFQDEMWLSREHCRCANQLSFDAGVLMWIDTAGQSIHYDQYGFFPDDQLSFAYYQFLKFYERGYHVISRH